MSRAERPPIDVLIVEDSESVRQRLKTLLGLDGTFRVALAADPYEAVARMRERAPRVVLLDIVMPRMDGLTFLRKLMRQHPLPVILCTDHVERGLAGLELGALDVIAKPDWDVPDDLEEWGRRLRSSLRQAVRMGAPPRLASNSESRDGSAEISTTEPRYTADAVLPRLLRAPGARRGEPVVVIGASTGGVQAITQLLPNFPPDCPGIVIVQHMPDTFTGAFAKRLDADPSIRLTVREASHGDPVARGTALIAPGHTHGLIRRVGSGYRFELVEGPPVNRHRPSVDVLFRSAAQAAGAGTVGVLLTGMGDDGAEGLREILAAGGHTIAQDEATCVVYGMPRAAVLLGAARQVLALDRIAAAVMAAVTGSQG